jgi:hypothetical protein
MKDQRYLSNRAAFLEYSYQALKARFTTKNDFVTFFEAIGNDDEKNSFLRTASFYLFLVKCGDWRVDIAGSNKTIDYLTDTYKYIAIFSLIESLQNKEFIDFYAFLIRRKTNVTFPIKDKQSLEYLYRKYKHEYGSIQQSVNFFKSLTSQRKADLVKYLEVKTVPPTIENLSKYLYDLRSKFLHEAQLIVNMSGRTMVSSYGKKVVVCKLSLSRLMEFFEEGLVTYFGKHNLATTADRKKRGS